MEGARGTMKTDETGRHAPNHAARASYELSDLSPKKIALFGITLAAVIGLVLVVCAGIFRYAAALQATRQKALSPLAQTREPTTEPRLQVHAARDLKEMRAAEDQVLQNYGWIDKKAGIARIPVDRAMKLLAQKGLPSRKEGVMATKQKHGGESQ
jgi:hypothetical protein